GRPSGTRDSRKAPGGTPHPVGVDLRSTRGRGSTPPLRSVRGRDRGPLCVWIPDGSRKITRKRETNASIMRYIGRENKKGGDAMEDSEIVALYCAREEAATEHTAQKYGAYLEKIACNILSDREDSQECANDTYLRAWNSMPTQRPSVLTTYLGRI